MAGAVFPMATLVGSSHAGQDSGKSPGEKESGDSLTRILAEMALQPDGDDIPAEACEAAKKIVLDTIGATMLILAKSNRNWDGNPANRCIQVC